MLLNTVPTERLKFRDLISTDTEKLFEIYSDSEAMKFRGSGPMLVLDNSEHIDYIEDVLCEHFGVEYEYKIIDEEKIISILESYSIDF